MIICRHDLLQAHTFAYLGAILCQWAYGSLITSPLASIMVDRPMYQPMTAL